MKERLKKFLQSFGGREDELVYTVYTSGEEMKI